MSNISTLSINRPVLATVMTLVILLFGFIGFTFLGVREYPSVDPPIITVRTSYPGANSDVIESQITEPLEQSINGIAGIRTLSSVSRQGQSNITIEFELSVDMETAANDVRDKVSQAIRRLPNDVDPPVVSKADADSNPIMAVGITSQKRSLLELTEIAELTLMENFQTVQGVSMVELNGDQRYSMRLALDAAKMAGYGVTASDISKAINSENVELPSGSIDGATTSLVVRTVGLMTTAEEFNSLIIRQEGDKIVRLGDVARAELAAEDERRITKFNSVPMVINSIIPQPGANHIQIADEIYRRIEIIKKDLPDDVQVLITFDNTQFIRKSISEVTRTLFEALFLVTLIIFLFLRDWRTTIIPVIAIPISIIGTFFIMYLLNYSINVLSLLAMVLAVTLVVDDAIVMVENIYVKIEKGLSPRKAGIEGAKEIFFAIIATTVVLVAVFVPIVFMEGTVGRLFREFSIVVAAAVIISSFVSLTLTPMLATKILLKKEKKNWFYEKTESFFARVNDAYKHSLDNFLRNRWWTFIIMAASIALIVVLWTNLPAEMAPLEDRSQISVSTTFPEGATFEYIRDFVNDVSTAIQDENAKELNGVLSIVRSDFAMLRVMLVDPDDRDLTQDEIARNLTRQLRSKTGARLRISQQPTFGGRQGGLPIQYVLQAPNLRDLQEILPIFMEKVNANPMFQMADVNLRFTRPGLRIDINREKAASLGVSVRQIAETLQLNLSRQRVGYFFMNGRQYQIIGLINRDQRNRPVDLKSLYVRSSRGEMIQLDNVVQLVDETAPPQLFHFNRFMSATVSAGLADGYTIGEGLDEMDKIAKEVLDDTFRTALAGESKDFRDSSSSLYFAFGFALLLTFLVLAAQFESFKMPAIIMFTVPLALFGALVFLWYFNETINIFSQIAIIMLVGLVAKNGILIVEFANQRNEHGLPKMQAIKEAAAQRFRPILMTSLAGVLGCLPLALATGASSNSRVAMGIAVIGGLFISTFLTLYIVPAIYSYIASDVNLKKETEEK